MQTIFISGGTGYLGSRLIKALDQNQFKVIALVRPGSESKLPKGTDFLVGDVFKPEEWANSVPRACIFIHLIGVAHPSPSKKKLFETIDLRALKIVADIAKLKEAKKIIYLSVAMEPSSMMKDFQNAKRKAEDYIISLQLPHIFVRPWYVLGPGHWWPYLLWPLFKLLEVLPSTARKAKAFAFVTIEQMIDSLIYVINHINDVPEIIEIADIERELIGSHR